MLAAGQETYAGARKRQLVQFCPRCRASLRIDSVGLTACDPWSCLPSLSLPRRMSIAIGIIASEEPIANLPGDVDGMTNSEWSGVGFVSPRMHIAAHICELTTATAPAADADHIHAVGDTAFPRIYICSDGPRPAQRYRHGPQSPIAAQYIAPRGRIEGRNIQTRASSRNSSRPCMSGETC
jgi:hypothetical protein